MVNIKHGTVIPPQKHEGTTDDIEVYKAPSEASPTKFDYILCANKAINITEIPSLFALIMTNDITRPCIASGIDGARRGQPHRPRIMHHPFITFPRFDTNLLYPSIGPEVEYAAKPISKIYINYTSVPRRG